MSALLDLLRHLPDEALIPVGWLREQQAAAEGAQEGARSTSGPEVDLTVEDVAARLARAPSTIRSWLGAGRFPNAYRLRGREWRIPASDVVTMQRAEAEAFRRSKQQPTRRRDAKAVRTDAWRQHLKST